MSATSPRRAAAALALAAACATSNPPGPAGSRIQRTSSIRARWPGLLASRPSSVNSGAPSASASAR